VIGSTPAEKPVSAARKRNCESRVIITGPTEAFYRNYADSDEENRSFRAEDDQSIAERRWQSIVRQVIVMSQEKGSGYRQHYFVSVAVDGSADAKFA
jgi:hypothetical protein